MIYTPGIYIIYLFNEVGAKKKTKTAVSYLLAQAKLEKFLHKHPTCSGVISFTMHNSREIGDKWGYNKKGK